MTANRLAACPAAHFAVRHAREPCRGLLRGPEEEGPERAHVLAVLRFLETVDKLGPGEATLGWRAFGSCGHCPDA